MEIRRSLPGRFVWTLITLAMVLLAVYLFRYPLLRATGNFLITSDPLLPSRALYVLGGASIDRGIAATHALHAGVAPGAWCLGELVPQSLKAEGIMIAEGQLTANVMLREGAPRNGVGVIPIGTSTWEESHAILQHALENRFDTITIVTTDFHTRRVGMVFRKAFRREGVTVLVHGAPSSQYDNQRWWLTEEGLLMVNNEYVKLMYYILKY